MAEAVLAIGTLTDRVQIKRLEADGTTFVPAVSVWARVRSLVSASPESHSVVIRFRSDVKPGDRMVFRGRNLDVVSAADLNGRRAYLRVGCMEAKSDAQRS